MKYFKTILQYYSKMFFRDVNNLTLLQNKILLTGYLLRTLYFVMSVEKTQQKY